MSLKLLELGRYSVQQGYSKDVFYTYMLVDRLDVQPCVSVMDK